jgi:PPK2 family polyphosphate:nucleotide phosphotransferase
VNLDLSLMTRPEGNAFRIDDFDPESTGGLEKGDCVDRVQRKLEQLRELQERLYASRAGALLIVLQGMDAGGKDGTIKHVMGAFNPQGVHITSFKVPTEEELAHDFLWRVHRAVPGRGMVGVFNRSHYEDVLVVRVKKLVAERVWKARYAHIRAFEELLVASGTAVVKLFLHISPNEQAKRLRDRQSDPEKQWKFNPGDLDDRRLWPRFMEAYEDALTRCNTSTAPWYVVPANHKWYRNLVVSEVLLRVLEGMDLAYPAPPSDIGSYEIPEV